MPCPIVSPALIAQKLLTIASGEIILGFASNSEQNRTGLPENFPQ